MIILDSNLNRLDAFTPESMNLTIEERKSVATITLGPNHPNIELGAWLLDDTEPGSGMIWRVKTVDTQYNTNTRTVSLEHIINTLRDTSIFGEVKPADITGNPRATECTAREAFAYCLARQGTWVLGAFEVSATNAYSFNGDSIFSALETITGTLDRAYWDFDLTRLPFRLNVRQFSSAVSCEMRTDRNIQTLKRTVDRSRMYTRFFPIGKNNLHLAGDCVTRNVSLYGAIDRVETDQSKETEAELRAWANERLSRHAEPSVSVQITGLELSQATGEPLDHLTINTQCRVPLPEFGTTITEKITKLNWSDKIREPEKVTINLANLLEDVASISNSAASSASKAGRAGAKKAEEDHAWFVDTTDHVGMVAEAIIGDQEGDIDWSRVSEVMVDGGGIYMSVKRTDGRVTTAETRIDQNEDAIRMEAKRATDAEGALSGRLTVAADRITAEVERATTAEGNLSGRIVVEAGRITQEVSRATSAESGLSGRITVEAGRITQEVTDRQNADTSLDSKITVEAGRITQEVTNRQNADTALGSRITQEADRISLVVEGTGANAKIKPASIVSAINAQTGQSVVKLSADVIELDGHAVAQSLESEELTVEIIDAQGGQSAFGSLYVANSDTGGTDWYSTDVCIGASVANGILTLEFADGSTVDFPKATSLSGQWSGTVSAGKSYKVTASPQGTTHYSPSLDGMSRRNDKSWSTNKKSFNQTIYVYDENGVDLYEENMTFTTSDSYDAGYDNAAGAMSWPSSTSSEKTSTTIGYPTSGGGSTTRTLELSADASNVYVKLGGTVVLKMAN